MKKWLLIIGLLGVMACQRADQKVVVLFDRVDGLEEESKVMSKGVIMGKVTQIALYHQQVLTELTIEGKHEIPDNSVFRIENQDLLGTKAIEVEPGDSKVMIVTGDTITGMSEQGITMEGVIDAIKEVFTDSTEIE